MDNADLAQALEAYAALLDLSGAGGYSVRAYRRAADLIGATKAPVAELVAAGRARELRGIGPSIEKRLRELVETGRIAELDELEREVAPELVALGRYLGLGPRRLVSLGRELGLRSVAELRAAADAGRLRDARGVGPETERKILAALADDGRRPRRGLTRNRAEALAREIADAVGGEVAGELRRGTELIYELCIVGIRADGVDRFAAHPAVVAVLERDKRHALGITVDGISVELIVAEPHGYGTELLRATGSRAYVDSLGELPEAPSEEEVYARLGLPFVPPELRETTARVPDGYLLDITDIRGDLHVHTTWSDGKATVLEMAMAARDRSYEYVAICDHTPNVRVVPGLDADALRRQAEEIAAANEELAPFRVLRGTECDIRADGSLDLPDDVLGELDWVQLSLHAGQRLPGPELTKRVTEAMRHPAVRCLSHPKGRILNHRPPNALDLDVVFEVALETGVAVETNGLP
ncbi:MAG: histidinol-phosphatase, partial [Actinobacteria bacterium]|nr:histidinol-phosphatase [Actinomycetota bacterium]